MVLALFVVARAFPFWHNGGLVCEFFTPSPFSLTQDPNSVQLFLFGVLCRSGRESEMGKRGPFC